MILLHRRSFGTPHRRCAASQRVTGAIGYICPQLYGNLLNFGEVIWEIPRDDDLRVGSHRLIQSQSRAPTMMLVTI